MSRLVHAVALGLVGAGIIHIVVLMLVPSYSQRDAWSTLAEHGDLYAVIRLDPPGASPLVLSVDPLFEAVACRFDLEDGVVRVHGRSEALYWSISVYDRVGRNIFSFNDRSATGGRLDFVVVSPVQLIELRNAMPEEFDGAVIVEADIGEGIAVVRAFAPDESWAPSVSGSLETVACAPH